MHIVYRSTLSLSLRLLLANKLRESLEKICAAAIASEPAIAPVLILPSAAAGQRDRWGLQLRTQQPALLYSSAIALKLAKPWQQPAEWIAATIAEALQQTEPTKLMRSESQPLEAPSPIAALWTQVELDLAIGLEPPGWLQFRFGDRGIALWLQALVAQTVPAAGSEAAAPEASPLLPSCPSFADSDLVWQMQYAHARCCSLLQLSESIDTLEAIAWLTAEGKLQFRQLAEWQLLQQISLALDELAEATTQPAQMAAAAQRHGKGLSRSFQQFYADCRLFGEIQTTAPELVQSRLGLLALCRWLLQVLLEAGLGMQAVMTL